VTAGVVLCDPENPCEDIVFDNVTNTPFTGNIDKLLQDLPFSYPQHDSLRVYREEASAMAFGDYISSNAFGRAIDPVSPSVCLEEGCWWEPPATVR
jgi:hypothetical protein